MAMTSRTATLLRLTDPRFKESSLPVNALGYCSALQVRSHGFGLPAGVLSEAEKLFAGK